MHMQEDKSLLSPHHERHPTRLPINTFYFLSCSFSQLQAVLVIRVPSTSAPQLCRRYRESTVLRHRQQIASAECQSPLGPTARAPTSLFRPVSLPILHFRTNPPRDGGLYSALPWGVLGLGTRSPLPEPYQLHHHTSSTTRSIDSMCFNGDDMLLH
jgi:hypothetical protein